MNWMFASLFLTEGQFLGRIPVEEESAPATGDIVGEIDSHFGLQNEDSVVNSSQPNSL